MLFPQLQPPPPPIFCSVTFYLFLDFKCHLLRKISPDLPLPPPQTGLEPLSNVVPGSLKSAHDMQRLPRAPHQTPSPTALSLTASAAVPVASWLIVRHSQLHPPSESSPLQFPLPRELLLQDPVQVPSPLGGLPDSHSPSLGALNFS